MGANLSVVAPKSTLSASTHSTIKSPIGPSSAQDPYSYTAGRWLLKDDLQRQSRSLQFDFPRLCETAVKLCADASKVVEYEKKEGGYNRVFILTMDTGKRLVARVPTPVAGPPRLTINSEVATITYLQLKTSLPIPKILAWDDDPSNPAGIEYIIQEHVDGVQLHSHWPEMDSLQHMLCTKDLTYKIREMAALDFPAFGNIYFSDAPIEEKLKIPLQDGFCIGPYCSPLFWNCGAGEAEIYGPPNLNRGPWRNLAEYTSGLIDTAYSRLPNKQSSADDSLPFRGAVEDHKALINACRETMLILTADNRVQKAATPTLIHPDYHKRNIYVSSDDPKTITGVIDWQLACIDPAFIYAHNIPDFASLPDENPADENEETSKTLSEQEQDIQKDTSICNQTYDVIMRLQIPKMRTAKSLDPIFFRLFLYCFTTWRDGAPAIRQELLDLKKLWPKLELPGNCPFALSEEEHRLHSRQYEDFEASQKLKMWLKLMLQTTSDGWVHNEDWDAAKEANRAAYDEWMESARESAAAGEDMPPEKADKLWPFDAR